MLLQNVKVLPEGAHWQYEVKWDGYRIQALKRGRFVQLQVVKALEECATSKCPVSDLPNCKVDAFDEMVTPKEMGSFIWMKECMEGSFIEASNRSASALFFVLRLFCLPTLPLGWDFES